MINIYKNKLKISITCDKIWALAVNFERNQTVLDPFSSKVVQPGLKKS